MKNSRVLLRYDRNININNHEDIRRVITSKYMVNRPEWYKTLRLVHRGLIKYLSNKTVAANDLLLEIKEKLNELGIKNIGIENKFEIDIQYAFWEICNRYNVDSDIIVLFEKLFENFNDNNYFCKRCGSKE